jgi:hypothetical protein
MHSGWRAVDQRVWRAVVATQRDGLRLAPRSLTTKPNALVASETDVPPLRLLEESARENAVIADPVLIPDAIVERYVHENAGVSLHAEWAVGADEQHEHHAAQ